MKIVLFLMKKKSKTSGFRLLIAELVYVEKLFLLYMREVRDSIIPFVPSHKTGRGNFSVTSE